MSALLDLLFPPKCPFCGRVRERPGVCGRCTAELPLLAEDEVMRTLSGGFVCAAPFRYQGVIREGLLRFKFQGVMEAAGPLGEWMARCAAERFSGAFDTVSWVPVSRKRLRQRGYDQAKLLAESMCRLWETRPAALLQKHRNNAAQSSLEGEALRWKNVKGVYRGSPEAAGRRILLIDDICTTGATLSSAAGALMEAGASSVVCCAAAHTLQEV